MIMLANEQFIGETVMWYSPAMVMLREPKTRLHPKVSNLLQSKHSLALALISALCVGLTQQTLTLAVNSEVAWSKSTSIPQPVKPPAHFKLLSCCTITCWFKFKSLRFLSFLHSRKTGVQWPKKILGRGLDCSEAGARCLPASALLR